MVEDAAVVFGLGVAFGYMIIPPLLEETKLLFKMIHKNKRSETRWDG